MIPADGRSANPGPGTRTIHPNAHAHDNVLPPDLKEFERVSELLEKIATTFWPITPEEFRLALAKAWFKLTHRDLGPRCRAPWARSVPAEEGGSGGSASSGARQTAPMR